jgi:hypothetical protein
VIYVVYKTEKEKQDEFVKAIGGRNKAEKLDRIWKNTYPRYCSLNDEYPKNHTKQEIFVVKALEEEQ